MVIPAPVFSGVNSSGNQVFCHSRRSGNPEVYINTMSSRQYYVYLLASKRNGTLYIGVTSNLVKRVHEHKNNLVEGFTKKYNVHHLVYFETTEDINSAITREKQMKKWKRAWKIELYEKSNPKWRDLYFELI
jgi:putative endonuclease